MTINDFMEILAGYPGDSDIVIGLGPEPDKIFEVHSIETMTVVSVDGAGIKALAWTGAPA